MALADFESPAHWRRDLDSRWPERLAMKDLMLQTLKLRLDQVAAGPRLLELGIGDGELMRSIAAARPDATFVAVDVNPQLLSYAREKMKTLAVECIEQDLSKPWTTDFGGRFDVVYSLQSFHDLGGYDKLLATYQQIAQVLTPGGLLLNADFLVPLAHDNAHAPRRFPADVHLALLHQCGYSNATLVAQIGTLGCLSATMAE